MPPTRSSRLRWPGFVSLSLPSSWTHQDDGGVISLSDPEVGVGVLQISFARRSRLSTPTDEEAVELMGHFCHQHAWSVPKSAIVRATIAGSRAAAVTLRDERGAFWRVWQVVANDQAMLITYNCGGPDARVEEEHLEAIVQSLQWDDGT